MLLSVLLNCVNALKGATFISTDEVLQEVSYSLKSVNALKGATFISTLQFLL